MSRDPGDMTWVAQRVIDIGRPFARHRSGRPKSAASKVGWQPGSCSETCEDPLEVAT